jgi:hypothetical protein
MTTETGRELSVLVFGDTADEIQLAALDAARLFFGDTVRLVIVPAYKVHDDGDSKVMGSDRLLYPASGGKKYRARVAVHTIEPGDPS